MKSPLYLVFIVLLAFHAPALANGYDMPALPGYGKAKHFEQYGIGFLQFDTLAEGICINYDTALKRCHKPYISHPVPLYADSYANAKKTGELRFGINHGTDYRLTDEAGNHHTLIPTLKGTVTGMIAMPVYEVRYCETRVADACEYDKEAEPKDWQVWYRTPHGWITPPEEFAKAARYYSWGEFFGSHAFAGRLSETIYPIIMENNFRSIYPLPLCSYGYYDGWCTAGHSSRNQIVGSSWDDGGKPYPLIGLQVYEGWMLVLADENNSFKTRMCTGKVIPPRGRLGWVRMLDNQNSTLLLAVSPLECEGIRK